MSRASDWSKFRHSQSSPVPLQPAADGKSWVDAPPFSTNGLIEPAGWLEALPRQRRLGRKYRYGAVPQVCRFELAVGDAQAGVYELQHELAEFVYVGSSLNLAQRARNWFLNLRAFLEHDGPAPSKKFEPLCWTDMDDWAFVVVEDRSGSTLRELMNAEEARIAEARRALGPKCLNLTKRAVGGWSSYSKE